MYAPARHDEITGLTNYIDLQLQAIRASIIGLTEEQARLRPCRSELSIGGLLKHAEFVMRGAIDRFRGPTRQLDEGAYQAFASSFALTDEERGQAALDAFDATRTEYLAALGAVDPAAATMEPPSPWYGIHDERPSHARYYLVHQVEELARHAGHADIIREQIDGVHVPAILLDLAGVSSDRIEPFTPAPGTIGPRGADTALPA